VRDVLKPIWTKTPETASRLRGRIEAVLDSARGSEDKHPNPAAWSGWLKTQLGKKKVKRDPITGQRVHLRALPFGRIPALMATLRGRPDVAARALEFLILTAGRSDEIIGAQREEIELEHEIVVTVDDRPQKLIIAAWVIPAIRMKGFRRHRVPLNSATLAILDAQEKARGDNPHIFPGTRPMKPMGEGMLMLQLKRLGVVEATTVHGLRASFRSWCKSVGVPFEVAEEALSHVSGDNTVKAYDRDDQLALRIPVMERWARFCLSAIEPAAPLMLEAPIAVLEST
jgi:integrase